MGYDFLYVWYFITRKAERKSEKMIVSLEVLCTYYEYNDDLSW